MRKILYIYSNRHPHSDEFLLKDQNSDRQVWIVLIQDAVHLKNFSGIKKVSVLKEDTNSRGVSSSFPVIEYRDLLSMILEADVVIAL